MLFAILCDYSLTVDYITTDEEEEIDDAYGYKIVGDNIDKYIKPRFLTTSTLPRFIHHFHFYAVKNRIKSDRLSDIPPIIPDTFETEKILPNEADHENIVKNFETLVAR